MSEKRVLPLLQRTGSSLGLNLSGLNTSAAPMTRRDSSIFSDSRLRKIADKLENVSDDAGSYTERLAETIENIRNTMKKLLYSSYIGKLFSVAMLLLSILSVIEYIYTTYLNQESDASQYSALKVLELIVALFFAFDWGLSFFVADHKMTFLSSFYSMVDLMTVVPIFATYSETCEHYMVNQYDYSAHQMIFYVLCSLNTTRILRALRLHRVVEKYLEDEVEKCLGHMALNIIVMILFNSALMQFIEENQNYAFHTWMYYMTVTITSVGYGDITPKTDLGRFTAMAMISFAIISVPQMTNELIEKMSRQSVYARLRYYPKTSSSSHVLVCGDLSSVSWKEFFEELFHEDHETKGLLDCVILQPNVPNYEMRNHMKDPRYFGCITYLEGSPLSDADLKRADAINARAIFLLTNKFTANPDEEDAKIILEQFSIQKYLRLYSIPGMMSSPLFCLQLIRPENRRHLVQVEKGDVLTSSSTASFYDSGEGGAGGGGGGNDGSGGGGSGGGSASLRQEESDVVICLNEIKMGVIAKAVMFPGTNTLIMNLLTSFSDDVAGAGAGNASHQKNAVKPMEGIETLEEDERGSDWIGEYQRGCDWEIYTTELSHTFEGTTFSALADMLYHKLGIVLFGLEVEEGGNQRYRGGGGSGGGSGGGGSPNRRSKIYLNPADYVIPSSDDCKVLAFVIAKNKAQSDLTFSKVNEDSIFHSGSGMTFTHISLLANAMNARLTGDVNPKAPVTPHNSPTITANKRSSGVARTSNASNTVGGGGGTTGGNLRTTISAHPRHRGVAFGLNLKKREKLPWQRLLHKYEQEKTTESIQEELQRYEDRMLHEHYFTRHNDTIELSDVYIQTSVSEDIPFVENHIIIIGKALSNLYDLIKPLRAKALGVLKHIIILYPYDFPMHVWQRIAVFESVWIVRGSGLEEADLRRCGIFKAKQVILLGAAAAVMSSLAAAVGGGSEGSSGGSGGLGGADKTLTSAGYETSNSALDDVDTVFCYQAIKRMNESAHIVVEIIHHSNVAYLDPESGLNSSVVDYKFTAQFSAGSLFASSILDTLVCQAFYNTKIIDILKKLIGVDEKITVNELPQSSGIGGGGGGGGKGSAVAAAKGLVNSSLYQIPLPEGLETRTYGALFSLLAKRKQIPLGILRGIFSNTKSGPKANILPYVFTNPPKDTELFSCDKIFVLSQTPIKITRIVKDESKEFHMYSTMRAKRKTAEDVLNLVNIVKDQVIRHHDKNNDLENKLTTLMTSFQQQMKEMTSCMSQIVQEVENQRQEKDYYLQQQQQQRYQTMMMSQSNDYNDDVITVTDVHGSGGGGGGSGGRYGRARSSTQDSILTTATSATSAARMNGSPKSARGVGKSASTSFIRPKAVVDPLPLGGVSGGGGSGGKSRITSVRTPPSSTPPQVQRKSNRQSPASSPLINTSSRKRFMNSNASV